MLLFDPSKRITIEEAISHKFFNDLHGEDDEPVTQPVDAFDFDFEKYDLSIDEIKDEILEEIKLYHSSKAQKKYMVHRQKYPNGMLHIKYKSLISQSGSAKDRKKVKK